MVVQHTFAFPSSFTCYGCPMPAAPGSDLINFCTSNMPLERWLRGLEPWGLDTMVRAALAAATFTMDLRGLDVARSASRPLFAAAASWAQSPGLNQALLCSNAARLAEQWADELERNNPDRTDWWSHELVLIAGTIPRSIALSAQLPVEALNLPVPLLDDEPDDTPVAGLVWVCIYYGRMLQFTSDAEPRMIDAVRKALVPWARGIDDPIIRRWLPPE